jgi:hypothetical protein
LPPALVLPKNASELPSPPFPPASPKPAPPPPAAPPVSSWPFVGPLSQSEVRAPAPLSLTSITAFAPSVIAFVERIAKPFGPIARSDVFGAIVTLAAMIA